MVRGGAQGGADRNRIGIGIASLRLPLGLLLIGAGALAAGCRGGCDKEDEIEAYADDDGDGFGGVRLQGVCALEAGMVSEPGDCDDADASVHPGASEPECNGIDEDCDGLDNGSDAVVFYQDLDDDGYGNTDSPLLACAPPQDGSTWARADADCDDADPSRNPGATEICNDGIDDDCDGLADDEDDSLDPTSLISYYPDNDGDGFGRPGPSLQQCMQPEGSAPNEDDCDDARAEVHPGAAEVCNGGIDDDCDGLRDDADDTLDPTDQEEFYADVDGDGFGDPNATVMACAPWPGLASDNADDCDDSDPSSYPGATEALCDGADNDCDPDTPDDLDRDDDGTSTCGGDCQDLNAAIHPGAAEIPGDGIDSDCDQLEACYQDADADGSRSESTVLVAGDPTCQTLPNAPASAPVDCDDTDPEITISGLWETDADLDGFGDGVIALTGVCVDAGLGYVLTGGEVDCDDQDPTVHPEAEDACNDGLDADCDTVDDCASCAAWLASDAGLPSGIYPIRPTGEGSLDVYCDMETDGGGWTLVASTLAVTLNDARVAYHEDLQTLEPIEAHPGVWDGLRSQISDLSDLRFACRTLVTDPGFTVDLSFYDVPWYLEITTGTDADSCFTEGGAPDPTPARRDNLTDTLLGTGNAYDSGALEGEDTCDDVGDFTVDLDDAGMDSDEADGTDWGEDDGKEKCGAAGSGESWYIFVREPPAPG